MAFDYVKFLAENKLTSTSKLDEKARLLNENYIDLRPINSLREDMGLGDDNIDDLDLGDESEKSEEGMYDFMSGGKKDEFDIDDEEPATKDIKSTDIEDILGGEEESSLQDLESELKALFATYGGAGVASKNPEYIQKAKDLSSKIRTLRAKQAEEEEF